MTLNPWAILGIVLGVLFVGFMAYERGYAEGNADRKALTDEAAVAASEQARAKERGLQAQIDALSAQLEKERHENEIREAALRADVADGKRRLSVRAACPARVPGDPGAAGSGDDAAVELAPEARRAYFDLRAAIIADDRALRACQGYAAAVSLPPK
ncbi:lysis system i-spanin subunit Rz [Parvibaculum sp.]|uniref:lysis system i-spanin subunit Rz n=1 Tax=Parvibaculum sp. TaxID=2024848 RepID=UPI002BCDE0B8|nr:lysis system i-spanin subunit Rz [Parvibaculum sp.]HUD52795.1 lysis system i-spanin subunit Rz [Parvibaculum sp.]